MLFMHVGGLNSKQKILKFIKIVGFNKNIRRKKYVFTKIVFYLKLSIFKFIMITI